MSFSKETQEIIESTFKDGEDLKRKLSGIQPEQVEYKESRDNGKVTYHRPELPRIKKQTEDEKVLNIWELFLEESKPEKNIHFPSDRQRNICFEWFSIGIRHKSRQQEIEYLKAQNKGFQSQYNDSGTLVNNLRSQLSEKDKHSKALENCLNCDNYYFDSGQLLCELGNSGVKHCEEWILIRTITPPAI